MATTTLKILRGKGYTQQQITDMLGIAQNTYSRLERPKEFNRRTNSTISRVL